PLRLLHSRLVHGCPSVRVERRALDAVEAGLVLRRLTRPREDRLDAAVLCYAQHDDMSRPRQRELHLARRDGRDARPVRVGRAEPGHAAPRRLARRQTPPPPVPRGEAGRLQAFSLSFRTSGGGRTLFLLSNGAFRPAVVYGPGAGSVVCRDMPSGGTGA